MGRGTMQVLITRLLFILLVSRSTGPLLEGWITHYDCPPFCGSMSNGETYSPWALSVAVDVGIYPGLANKCLMVTADEDSLAHDYIFVTVTDSGHLYSNTEDWDRPIILDFPEATFTLLAPVGNNGLAGIYRGRAWLVPAWFCPDIYEDWYKIWPLGGT